jgi:multimeric flavodoxin WrbA
MKTLVAYYSNSGNNKYLAERIARSLNCNIEAIKPRLNVFPFLILFSLIKTSLGIKSLRHQVKEYDRIVVCSPIWMGMVISPLADFIRRYRKDINRLYFACCCASTDAAKRQQFGYELVFDKIKNILGDKCVLYEAFPVGMVLPEDKKTDGNIIMKTRLSDENFRGEIKQRFEDFTGKIGT